MIMALIIRQDPLESLDAAQSSLVQCTDRPARNNVTDVRITEGVTAVLNGSGRDVRRISAETLGRELDL